MPPVKAQVQDGRLVLSLPQDALLLEQAVQLLELFVAAVPEERNACLDALAKAEDEIAPLSDEDSRYIATITRGLQRRDEQAIRFAEADLYALNEAERLGIKLTARQRNTLIQYYVERQADAPAQPTGGSSSEAALARARILAERMRRKR
ncbi:hypothetical protein [Ferrovibrio sp.]|uniref:hypothetical protein n=1 Tax=Ferrovibrio sp. TaxID=1917215 RepID=UPI000CC141AE|nr:hypothetical protein [Ferrovibrio sp.]PJI40970.1 MAG: hypothetical protein CTR53_09895 [Ferrovibrio sp.]